MSGKAGSSYKGRRYRSYVCVRATRARAECGYYNGHAAKKLETAVLDYLGQYSDPKLVKQLLSEDGASRLKDQESELRRLEKKLASLDQDFKKNLEYLKKGLFNEEEFGQANSLRRDERTATESRLAELRAELESARLAEELTTALPDRISSFLESMQELETPKAKAILQTILKSAHIWRDGKIELQFR